MKFVLTSEKYGINKNLKDQVDRYYKFIINSPDRNVFIFYYKNEYKEIDFKLIINPDMAEESDTEGLEGQYHIQNAFTKEDTPVYTITINDRENYGTLQHEVKHMDFYIRRRYSMDGDPDRIKIYNDIFKQSKEATEDAKGSNFKKINFLFYQYDKDEFEAKYNGYYADFERYLLSKKSNDLTRKELFLHFVNFINGNGDQTAKEYLNNKPIDFDKMFSKKTVNKLFYSYILDDEYLGKWETKLDIFLEFLINKEWIKTTFNIYSKEEKEKINRVKNHFEKEINKRKKKYRKKFTRMITAMFDKYVI